MNGCFSLAVTESMSPVSSPETIQLSEEEAEQLAEEISQAWRKIRAHQGHSTDHAVMALGGRKDSEGTPGAPLQQGGWGVDVVETHDPDGFLQAINWSGLTAGRPADGIFQVIDRPA